MSMSASSQQHVCQSKALEVPSGCLHRENRDKDNHKSTSVGSGDANF